MNERDEYEFCPKCGALTQNGVCQSCGYGSTKQSGKPPHRKRSLGEKIVIGICIAVGVMVLLSFLGFFLLIFRTVSEVNVLPDYGSFGDGYYDHGNPYDNGQAGSGGYIPNEDDEYYQEITDATELGLAYGINWQSVCVRPDDPDDLCTYDCVYPVLTGEDTDKLSRINEEIERMAFRYQDQMQEYPDGVSSSGYVTYMDEEKISVVFRHDLSGEEHWTSMLEAVTYRMDTGEKVPHSQMQEVDDELVRQFRARDSRQNGTVEFVENMSDEELKGYLVDEKESVMFYTPVGLEIGFNYDGGWVTVTLKDSKL